MTPRPALILIGTAGVLLLATPAVADPRAEIRGTMDAGLRAQLVRAVGEVDGAPSNRFEARRRARGALQAAEALLRSEGYYQPVLEDEVEGEDAPVAIVNVTPGRRFELAGIQVVWTEPAPDEVTANAVRGEVGLTPGQAGRAGEVGDLPHVQRL